MTPQPAPTPPPPDLGPDPAPDLRAAIVVVENAIRALAAERGVPVEPAPEPEPS